ncbi:MAG TPA: hypothetical protein PKI62_06190 [bacterium]|nr:hypothetical protein [bacterium]HPR86489.1 hypothetical protein [bacterium]
MKTIGKYLLLLGILVAAVTAAAQTPQEALRLQMRAQQLEALGRLDEAGELYARAALGLASQRDLNAYSSARHCFERIKALDAWEALILGLQQRFRALLFEVDLAEIAWLRNDQPEARQRWRQIIADNPLDEQAYALVGSALLKYTLYDEARELYEGGRKAFKTPDKFVFELVRVYAGQGAYDRMTAEYLHFLEKNRNQTSFVQSQLLAAAEEAEVSRQIVAAIERAIREDATLKEQGYALLAALYTQQRAYEKALHCYDYLEELASSKPAEVGRYYYSLATVALNDSALADARAALEKLLARTSENNPYRPQAAFALAQLLEKEGAYDQAAAGYRAFIRAYPDRPEIPSLYLHLGALYFERFFRPEAADSIYAALLQRPLPQPARLVALQKRAECAVARGDLEAARSWLQGLKRDAPPLSGAQRQADLMRARLEVYEGRPVRALQQLEAAVRAPRMQASAAADTVQNDILDLLLLLRESRRDSLGCAVFGKALWLQQQRRYAAALDTLRHLEPLAVNKSLQERARFLQVDLLRCLGRTEDALAVCTTIFQDSTSLEPDLAVVIMAEICQERSEPQKARQLLESFLEKYPESIYIEQVRGRIRLLERRKPSS